MSKDGRIWLSHTGIESLNRCPRCFWLQYKKDIRQPEGIVSRLANRFDVVMKGYFNQFREKNTLPPLIQGKISGRLQNPFQEKYFVTLNDSYGFLGKLDECIVTESGEYIPVDFKTSSSDPRNRETLSAYQSQIDDYLFVMQQNGRSIGNFGYLIYIYPEDGVDLHNQFPMVIHVAKLSGDPQKTSKRIKDAIEVLEHPMPSSSPSCPFCNWYDSMKILLENSRNEEKSVQQNLLDDIA
ncbi:hypothetical protein HYW55_02745 [Candidatus Gottesmanbacteria bacterium]|nr:hypothetical protein [Candidatus Gottesmanbacteria bacterium]